MTDYLEEHLEQADALLKQVRKMEQGMPVLLQNEGKKEEKQEDFSDVQTKSQNVSEEDGKVDNLAEQVDQIESKVDNLDADTEMWEKEAGNAVNQNKETVDILKEPQLAADTLEEERQEENREPERQTNAEKAEKKEVPLAVQLEELDRAVSMLSAVIPVGEETGLTSFSSARKTGVGPDMTGAPAGGWNTGVGTDSAASSSGGAQSWAEQADRVFRRDSRRYDGGFSLY